MPKNDDWARVTVPGLKPYREFNVPADAVTDDMKVLDKDTHNVDGSPVEAKYTPESLAGKSGGKAGADGQKADTQKENS